MAKLLRNFLEQTSIHGMVYLVDNRIQKAEKIFWLLTLLLSCIGCISMVWEVAELIRDDPIITYTSDTPVAIGEIPFVATTMCPYTNTHNNEFNYDDLRSAILTKNITISDLTEKELKYMQAVGLVAKDDFLTSYNITIDANDVIDFIVALKRTWHSEKGTEFYYETGDFYNTIDFANEYGVALAEIITPWGFCYCFNVIDASELFHLDRIDPIFNFTRPITFKHIIQRHKKYAILNNESYPWKSSYQGLGLWSEINLKTFGGYEPTYHESFVKDGSSYRFHSPYELPFFKTNEHISEIFAETQFSVTPHISNLGESLIEDSIERRQCYHPNEKTLQTFRVYTKNNCIQECLTNATLETCGCVQFFMPRNKMAKVCGIVDQKCTDRVVASADLESSCKCLPLCDDIKYTIEQRQTDQVTTSLHGSIITVQFGNEEFYPTIKQRKFTEIDFLSYIGGTLGLFAGFSILTVFELLSHFVVRSFLGWIVTKTNRKKVQPIQRLLIIKQKKLSTVSRFVNIPLRFGKSYVENSSIHGIAHASQENLSFLERILWLALFAASIGFSCFLLTQTYQSYKDAPILMSLDSQVHTVQSIPFPAITIAHERELLGTLATYFTYMFFFWKEQDMIDRFNESGLFEKFYTQEMMCLDEDVIYRNFEHRLADMVEKIRNESDIDRFSNHLSSWNSEQSAVFSQIITKYGFAFSFNLQASNKMFKKSISSDFHFDQYATTTKPLTLAANRTDPNLYPLHTGAELAQGLEILMHKRNRPDHDICRTATFVLHSPFELPNAFDFSDYCDFDYQKVVTVSIIPEVIYTDSSLRSINPEKRNCFFDGERELKYFRTYSKVNCEMECISELALKKCYCTPFYFVRDESMPLCYLNDIKCLIWDVSPKSLRHCGCLERCNSVNYRFEVRSDKLSTDYNENSTEEVVLRFRFKENEFMPTLRHQPFTFIEFLAQSGGLLGLFVGASFLSVVEIFYFFTLRLFVDICRTFKIRKSKPAHPIDAWND